MYKVVKRNDGKYAVIKEGQTRAYRVFDNLKDANELKNKLNGTKNSADTNKVKSSNETDKKEISKNEDMKVEKKNNKESSSNNIKKTKKRKSKKKNKALITILVIVFILFVGFMALWYFNPNGIMNSLGEFPLSFSKKDDNDDKNNQNEGIIYDDFQIHFLELGNYNAGDSIYIKAGDNDILIDAGSKSGSSQTIKNYLNQYVTDGKLEYVIATHAHEDHISAFVGNSVSNKGDNILNNYDGILCSYKIDNIITYNYKNTASSISTKFEEIVNTLEANGTKRYRGSDFFDNNYNALPNANIKLTDSISFDILYNQYYFEKSSDENNHSVCTMFNYNDHHFMFTGDLEKDGEEKLASYYDGTSSKKTLPEVDLFKAGHHGSKTSSNDSLLSLIKPKMCVVCCCAGSTEYTANNNNIFPTQDFIDRIKKYTDAVYVTSMYDNTMEGDMSKRYRSMNGNIIVSSDGTSIGLAASNNLTKLKDTDWFNEEVYLDEKGNIAQAAKKEYYTDTSNLTKKKRRTW